MTAAAEADFSPVMMLNLLRFDGDAGRASYARYGEAVVPMVQAVGGEVVFSGSCADAVIGDQGLFVGMTGFGASAPYR